MNFPGGQSNDVQVVCDHQIFMNPLLCNDFQVDGVETINENPMDWMILTF